jgi:hypothetical protein
VNENVGKKKLQGFTPIFTCVLGETKRWKSYLFFAQGSNDDEDKEHHWSFCHMLSLSKMVCI